MKSQKRYKAFTLIEIIVSIIVVGIVMATLPVLMDVFKVSGKTNVKEEIFFSQFSMVTVAAHRLFDENNTVDDNYYKDVNATAGDSQLLIEKYGDDLNRLGKEQFANNDYRSGTSYTTSAIGIDSGEDKDDPSTFDDVDDFNGYGEHLDMYTSKGIDINVSVYYIKDETEYDNGVINFTFDYSYNKDVNNTNIKLIKVYTVVDGRTIALYYPACNIGVSKILSTQDLQ